MPIRANTGQKLCSWTRQNSISQRGRCHLTTATRTAAPRVFPIAVVHLVCCRLLSAICGSKASSRTIALAISSQCSIIATFRTRPTRNTSPTRKRGPHTSPLTPSGLYRSPKEGHNALDCSDEPKGRRGQDHDGGQCLEGIAATGLRVSLVDLDPQAHATLHLGVAPAGRPGAWRDTGRRFRCIDGQNAAFGSAPPSG